MTQRSDIVFHFDFISPFGYFASLRIDELAARHGRGVDWSIILLGVSVLKVMGLKPLLETPLKGDYIRREVPRYARRHGIRLGREIAGPIANPLASARAFQWVKTRAPALARPVARAIFHAYWGEGRDIATPEAVTAIAAGAGADPRALADALASGEAAELLKAAVAAAIAKGVFGSPFFLVDGEPFWGVQSMPTIEEWLATGGW